MIKNNNDNIINLSDLIDLDFLQEFQDTFAKAVNVASITVDNKGSLTKPSNFTDFCIKYTRETEKGLKRCVECDIRWGKLAASRGEPVIYDCHSGLTDFAVPIIVQGQHLGSILGGQVLTSEPNEEHFRRIARELGINEEEYIQALQKIKIVSRESVEAAAKLLFLVANSVSNIALKNLELKQRNHREYIYRTITETIRSSLDFDKTKQKIVDIVGKTFDADRCFIMEYDKITDKFLVIQDEFLSSEKISSYKGADINAEVPNFVSALKKGKEILINNKEIYHDMFHSDFEKEHEAIEKYRVFSAYGFPLFYSNELVGALGLHYVIQNHVVTEEERSLLNIVSDQIAIALHQSEMYREMQIKAEREKINRNIIQVLRNSLDKNTIKHIFVENLAEYFEADRVVFSEFDNTKKVYLPISPDEEYIRGDNNFSLVSYDWSNPELKSGIEPFLSENEVLIYDMNEHFEKQQASQAYVSVFTNANVKSLYGIPVKYKDNLIGYFALMYEKATKITTEDLLTLRLIAAQAGIGFHQAELLDSTQKAYREKTEFIVKISDELSEPLNHIIESSETLTKSHLDRDKEVRQLMDINIYAKKLLKITNKLVEETKDN